MAQATASVNITFWSVTIQMPVPNRPVFGSWRLRISGTPAASPRMNCSLNFNSGASDSDRPANSMEMMSERSASLVTANLPEMRIT